MSRAIINFSTVVIILVFTYTATSKLTSFSTFERQMLNQPLPEIINYALLWTLPAVELVIALLLIDNRTRLLGLVGASALMTGFTVYLGLMVLNVFERVPCSCGGILQSLSWNEHLVVNIILSAFSYIALILQKRRYHQKTTMI